MTTKAPLVALALLLVSCSTLVEGEAITSFDACVAAGNPVLESYPRRCRTEEGQMFTEDIGNELEVADRIRLSRPRPNTVVGKQIVVEGEARGNRYFEASFPIELQDGAGNVLATTVATAQGEWMTEDFVPFYAVLDITSFGSAQTGTLVLKRDNPSGLPENDAQLIVPVVFANP